QPLVRYLEKLHRSDSPINYRRQIVKQLAAATPVDDSPSTYAEQALVINGIMNEIYLRPPSGRWGLRGRGLAHDAIKAAGDLIMDSHSPGVIGLGIALLRRQEIRTPQFTNLIRGYIEEITDYG